MVLVAATALGLGLAQTYMPRLLVLRFARSQNTYVGWLIGPPSCVAVAWMVALLGLRLRRPRPSYARLARQPGLVACAAGAAALLPGLLRMVSVPVIRGFRSTLLLPERWFALTDFVGPCVTGAWMALALSGRWQNERGWIDRSGRLVGAYWITNFLVVEFYHLVREVVTIAF
jgi:hypothetical protein